MITDPNGSKNLEKAPAELPQSAKFKTLPRFLSDFSYDYSADIQIFTSKINIMGRKPKHAKAESVVAAKKIADLAGEKLSICLLPGLESKLMFEIFCEAGLKFDAVILKFKDNLNSDFVNEAIEMCHSRNIKPTVADIDIIHFLESGKFFEYAEKYECRAPEICLHLWLLDQIGSAPVLSGSFAVPLIHEGLVYWSGIPTDLHVPYFNYFEKNKRAGEPCFFLNSIEFAVSFLQLSSNESFRSLKLKTTDTFNQNAMFSMACQEMGYDIGPSEKPVTDFEKVKKFYDDKMTLSNGDAFTSLFALPLELSKAPAKIRRQMVPLSMFTGKPDGFGVKQVQLNLAALKTKIFGN